jgi:hypothetical protein
VAICRRGETAKYGNDLDQGTVSLR